MLAAVKASLSPAQLQDIIDATAALKEAQAADDSEEAKATIPRLSRSDIDPLNKEVPMHTTHPSLTLSMHTTGNGDVLEPHGAGT